MLENFKNISISTPSVKDKIQAQPKFSFKPLKKVIQKLTFNPNEFEPVNEFGVCLRTIIKCDGSCLDKCTCSVSSGKGIKIHTTLKPYQIPTIKWMIDRETNPICDISGGLLSLSMGLGKTICALSIIMRDYTLLTPPEFPTLVVCPLSAIYTWKEQIDTFLGDSCPYLIVRKEIIGKEALENLTLTQLKKYRIIITNYETIRSIAGKNKLYMDLFEHDQFGRRSGIKSIYRPTKEMMENKKGEIMLFNIPYQRIVMDEAHNFNNPKSSLFYSMMCLYSKRKWCLTGTPIRNYSSDVFSQFRVLGFEKVLLPRQFSLKLYSECRLDKCILYMTKEDANIKLPKLNTIIVPIVLEGKEREIYDYFMKATAEAHEGFLVGCVSFANVLTLFLRLRQCCISAYTITEESSRNYNKSKVNKDNYTHSQEIIDCMTSGLASWIADKNGTAGIRSAKIIKTIEIIKETPLEEKIIIFTNFKKVIDVLELAIKKEFPDTKYEIVDGDVNGDKRGAALDNFKKGRARILIISYKVGSESLNLIEGTRIILLETVWCPSVTDQAGARSHRVGQENPVFVYQLVAENSVEYRMLGICQKKRDLFSEFITSKGRADIKLDSNMLRNMIS